jgi:hypothetical protein
VGRLGTRDLRALLDVVGVIGYEPETESPSLELLSGCAVYCATRSPTARRRPRT